jgi:DNA-binding MarR family transcriptional regulator
MRQRLRHRARWAIGIRLSDLEPMTTLVALTLAGWADQDGNGARPSVAKVADGCRLKRRAVTDHITKLEQAGWIRRTHGRGVPNRYALLIPTEMEFKIEAQLGEWTEEVRHGGAVVGEEVRHQDAPSTAPGRSKYGSGALTSLTEPDIEPSSANSPLRGSPTHTETETDGDAPWADHPRGWQGYAEDQKRIEEEKAAKASEARVEAV